MIKLLPARILGAGLLLVVLLVGLVVYESRARTAGQEVVLAMEAVDPRNLLTGHYVSLRLTQALLPGQSCPPRTQPYSEGGWLALGADGAQHRFVGAGPTREAAKAKGGDVLIRGGVYCSRVAVGEVGESREAVTLDIGVERFHAGQDQAQAMETALRGRRDPGAAPAFAVVSVGDDGRARLKGVILDGKRTNLDWW
ncbi:MAG: GDYXXLXY domain-containing protein [Pseudomonadota bacterium]